MRFQTPHKIVDSFYIMRTLYKLFNRINKHYKPHYNNNNCHQQLGEYPRFAECYPIVIATMKGLGTFRILSNNFNSINYRFSDIKLCSRSTGCDKSALLNEH